MVPAEFISLSGCLSYTNVKILLPQEYDLYSLTPHFEEFSLFFIWQGQVIETHQFNSIVIKLDSNNRSTGCGTPAEIIISDDMRYPNSFVIPEECDTVDVVDIETLYRVGAMRKE